MVVPSITETVYYSNESVHAIVDASKVVDQDFRKQYRLILVILVEDNTIDPMQDTVIDKSHVFTIPDGHRNIEVPFSKASLERRIGKYRMISFTLLCVPNAIGTDDFRNIEEAESKGAKICSGRGMSMPPINAVTPN